MLEPVEAPRHQDAVQVGIEKRLDALPGDSPFGFRPLLQHSQTGHQRACPINQLTARVDNTVILFNAIWNETTLPRLGPCDRTRRDSHRRTPDKIEHCPTIRNQGTVRTLDV
jgi:IS4 transposase